MMHLNRTELIGNIGKTPEFKFTKDGTPVLSFSLAQNFNVKEREITEWYNIAVFEKLAETLNKYLKSGMKIYVDGHLRIKNYEDNEGNKRTKVYIAANKVIFFGNKESEKEVMPAVEENNPEEDDGEPF